MDFLSFKSALSLLLESKKELKSLLDRGKVTQEQYDDILDSLPEKLEKYAGWIGRNINNTEASINHIINLIHWFENNKNKINEKDINKYTVDTLQSTFDKIGVSKSQQQKEIKGEGAKLITETDEYLLYEIYNHKASCYYGSGTKWCITGKNPNNPEGGSQSWDRYTKEGANFMFLIKKNGVMDDIYYKVAIAYIDKYNVRYILAAFNSLDKQINKNKLKNITKSLDNNWNYNYFKSEMWFGDVPFEIMKADNLINKVIEGTYTIQSDGTFDVNGNVNMNKMNLTKIPVKFGKITGYFDCSYNQLTTLEGAPQSVGRHFNCRYNQLTSLEGAPQSVGRHFDCTKNQLTTLEGAPQSVSQDFFCSNNQLTALKGAPQSVGGNFYCSNNRLTSLESPLKSVGKDFSCSNNQLNSLEGAPQSIGGAFICTFNRLISLVGAPRLVGGSFICHGNRLINLKGAPQSVGGDFNCRDNQLVSLEGAPKSVNGNFDCSDNKVKFSEEDVLILTDVKGDIYVI